METGNTFVFCYNSPPPIRSCWMQVTTQTTCSIPGFAVVTTTRGSRRSFSPSPITTCRQPDCCWRPEPWQTKTRSNVCRYVASDKWSRCGSAVNLLSFQWPAEGGSNWKKKNLRLYVSLWKMCPMYYLISYHRKFYGWNFFNAAWCIFSKPGYVVI